MALWTVSRTLETRLDELEIQEFDKFVFIFLEDLAQSAGAIEYTHCTSAEG